MNLVLQPVLTLTYNQLSAFSEFENFWNVFDTVFGTQYNRTSATSLRSQWQTGDFSQLPQIEIISSSILGNASGAYAISTNKIYLADSFLATATPAAVSAVLLEEIGHFIDAQINRTDRPGDEGAIFAALVQGSALSDGELQQLTAEDDSAVITVDAQTIQIEQAVIGANAAFDLIGLTQLRNDPLFAGIDGSGFTVAVLDTGLDATNTRISPNFRAFADFVDGGSNPTIITNASNTYDSGSHGTHVAGTVGARDENIGVATDVGLIGLRAIGPFSALRNALQWVLDNRSQYNIIAVNMSLGARNIFLTNNSDIEAEGGILTEINDIINRLEAAGVTIVTAAGNDYFTEQKPGVSFPAISSTINVGAVWQDGVNSGVQFQSGDIDYTTGADRLTSFSQRLDDVSNIYDTLFAPGAFITSTVPGGGTDRSAGTSQASPHVAGAVALLQEAALQFGGRLLTPTEIVSILRSTADIIFDGDDEDDNVVNTNTSYRRLNIYNAITEIRNRFGQVAPPPPGGGVGDANGTITGAYRVTTLDGSPIDLILGSIGTDGGTTQIGNKDVDIFRFEVAVAGTVTIELASNPDNPNDFDTFVRLFNSSGSQLAFDDDSGAGSFSRLQVTLNPGVYYAGVSGYNNANYNPNVAGSGVAAATGNYSIQFSLSNTDLNGLLQNAVDISLGSTIDPYSFQNGSIGADYGEPVGTGDVDLYKVIVPDNGILYIDIDTPFDSGYVDSYLRLFDADGNQAFFEDTGEIIISDDDLSFDANEFTEFTDPIYPGLVFEDPTDRTYYYGHTTDSFLAGGVRRGEVYYIGISDFANQNYNTQNRNNRSTAGTGGLYNLTVQFINNDRDGSIAQAIPNLALPITNRSGTIGVDTDSQTGRTFQVGDLDVDFVRIRAASAGILELDVDSYSNASITTPVDTVLSIFDVEGNLLAENDDTNGLDPLLQYRIQANTDYFVAVSGYGNSNFDPLILGSGTPGDTGQYIFNSRLLSTSQAGNLSNDVINYALVQNQPVTIGSTVFANIGSDNNFVIGPRDVDLYRFVPTFTGRVRIRTSTYEEFSADTFLRFFNANGTEIAFNNNENGNTRGSYLEVQVTAGNQYYIGVNGYSSQARNYNPVTGTGAVAGSQGNYSLTLTQVPRITLAVSPSRVAENGTPNLIYTFTRTGSTANPLTVSYGVAGTATFNTDYTQIGAASFTSTTGTITFAAGASRATLTINPKADTTIENNETVAIALASRTSYTVGTTTAVTGTILNDDTALSINDITVVEGQTSSAVLTVSLSRASSQTVRVNYTTIPGTATASSDYTTRSGTLTFAPNTTTATIAIPIVNNTVNEANETFRVTLSSPTNATLQKATGTVTITDTLQSSSTITLPTGVENLTLIGTGNINGTGNSGNNILQGNRGNNTLNGSTGNDTYAFNASTQLGSDHIQESTTGGNDTISFRSTTTAVQINLGVTTTQTVNSNLKLTLSANNVIENVVGGNGSDRLTGNSLNNALTGGSGNDVLNGGSGNDSLNGGAGNDSLTGGTQNDRFVYSSGRAFTSSDFGIDNLADFTPGSDQLVLSKTTFTALRSIVGNGLSQATDFARVSSDTLAATSSAYLVYSTGTGSLFYNQNGSAAGLGSGGELANLLNLPTLTAANFAIAA
ncbi:S8 family serine peptidase [Nostoc sp. CHAB 5844]|nr:S8 family serine peptidase [Nostoc sp. CHAB 5844]